MADEKAKKTILFYGSDAKAAKEKYPKPKVDEYQVIQADAYQGERLEADEIEFMDDVPAGERERIENLWGKFDNRVSVDPAKVGGTPVMDPDPAKNRANLTARRPANPDDHDAKELEHRGVAEKAGAASPDPTLEDHKGVGLDANTGFPVQDRNKIPRGKEKSK
jgi:hypothetical protein